MQRYIKLHPYTFFDKDTLTVWIDGNLPINDKLYEYIKANEGYDLTFKKHLCNKCIYQECDLVIKCKKDTPENVNRIRKRYQQENVPKNLGMVETNIIIRKDKEWVRKLMEEWWKEIKANSHRDQLSVMYVVWKYNFRDKIHVAISYDFNPRKHKQNNNNTHILNQSSTSYNNTKIRGTKSPQTKTATPQIIATLPNDERFVRKATPKRNIDVYNKRPINKPKRIKNM